MLAYLLLTAIKPNIDLRTNGIALTEANLPNPPRMVRMWVQGKPTRWTFTSRAYLDVDASDSKGRMAWSVYWLEGEPFYTVVNCFTNVRGHVEPLPFRAQAMDSKGRLVGGTGQDAFWADPYEPHQGWLWDRGRLIPMGPATQLRFRGDGTVEGYGPTDRKGKPINAEAARLRIFFEDADIRYQAFTWNGGKRTNDLPTTWKPW